MSAASLPSDRQSKLKQEAADYAVQFVKSGMVVGLGTGSTAIFATRRIAELLREGTLKDILGFATSNVIWREAQQLGIPLMDQGMPSKIDLTIDGADEVDPKLNLIKGGGGALFREKIVAQASDREIIIVDDSKLSPCLGTKHTLPVEVSPFGWRIAIAIPAIAWGTCRHPKERRWNPVRHRLRQHDLRLRLWPNH